MDCVKGKLVVTYAGLILVGKFAQIGVSNISLDESIRLHVLLLLLYRELLHVLLDDMINFWLFSRYLISIGIFFF